MSKSDPPKADDQELLSLRAAAKLAGVPRAYLDECVASGRLAVHLRHTSKGAKFRVTRAGLEAAGIISRPDTPEPSEESLVRLFREQAERLAAVEEQRFQLAGQLGAALERSRILEAQLLQLAATSESDSSVDASSAAPRPANDSEPRPGVRPDALDTAHPSPSTFEPPTRTIGAKPAPDWPPKRAATALARLRGIVRRASRP